MTLTQHAPHRRPRPTSTRYAHVVIIHSRRSSLGSLTGWDSGRDRVGFNQIVYLNMQDQLLAKYHELTLQIEALEEQKSALSMEIQSALKTDGLEKLQCPFGTFSLVKTAKYTFTDAVKALEDQAKALKEEEKTSGKATVEEKETLRFQAKKV